jgi:hypothetical protein
VGLQVQNYFDNNTETPFAFLVLGFELTDSCLRRGVLLNEPHLQFAVLILILS